MKTYKGVKLPACDGRPQLWTRADFYGLRVVYPSGRVDYASIFCEDFGYACTSRATQLEAQKAVIDYCKQYGYKRPKFLGYL